MSLLRPIASAPAEANRIRGSARRHRQSAGSRGHAGADLARRMALGAGGGDRGDDPAVHQPAILAALLHRLHPAQHRIFLSADRPDAAVYVPDLSGNGDRAARPHSLVRSVAVRRDLRRLDLADAQRAQGRAVRLGIRRRAAKRDRGRPRDVVRADGGAAAHRRLEPAAERAPLHRLSAVRRSKLARAVPRSQLDARPDHGLSRAVRREPARHSDPGLRRHRDRLPRVRHRADDDRRRKILHQHRLCAVRHLPWRRGESLHLRLRPARHDVGLDHFQRADRRHHDDSGHEEERLPRFLCRCDRGLRLDRRGAGAAGDGRDRVRDRAIPQCQLRRRGGRCDHTGGAVLCRPVHAGRLLRRPAWPEGHSARRAAEDHGIRSRPAGTTFSSSRC